MLSRILLKKRIMKKKMVKVGAKVTDETLEEIDRLVKAGVFSSRSELVRKAILGLLVKYRKAR